MEREHPEERASSSPPTSSSSSSSSLLPAWLLASKALTQNLQRNSTECQERLSTLKEKVVIFKDMVDRAKRGDGQVRKGGSLPPLHLDAPDPIFLQDFLGPDMCVVILQFCDLTDWLRYGQTCSKNYSFIFRERSDHWQSYYDRHFLKSWWDVSTMCVADEEESKDSTRLKTEVRYDMIRKKSVMHARACATCNKAFFRLRKDRCRERQSDPSPFVFNRKDKSVAYPLPMRRSVADKKRNNRRNVGLLMSQVNTSSPEQRRLILNAMVRMSYLTANPRDVITCDAFIDMGGVTMLTALLANESGAVKELAALCLGNLVVTPPLPSPLNDDSDLSSMLDWQFTRRCDLRREVQDVRGVSALVALLSSPQARVTLHGVGGSHSFMQERVASMRCQSLGNKHASRALINLLLPDLEICVGDKEHNLADLDPEGEETDQESPENVLSMLGKKFMENSHEMAWCVSHCQSL